MRWFWLFFKEDVIRSFRLWERAQAVIALITAAIVAGTSLAIRSQVPGFPAEQSIGIGLVSWFCLLVFVFTPIRMAIEKVKMGAKRLRVVGSENYNCGRGYNWLRLRVENPTGTPIPNCYGRLNERKLVASGLMKIDGQEGRFPISPEVGRESTEIAQLPPERHNFPWSPESPSDALITISGFNGKGYLYYAAKLNRGGEFGFPSELGIKYRNFNLGDFELEIEVGSESENFKPTKVCVTFRAAGGDLEFLSMKDVD
jgi:hypothetical protein